MQNQLLMGNIIFKQLIVYVNNMENMVNFYRDIVGLTIAYPHVDDYSNQSYVSFGTGDATFALHAGKENTNTPLDAPKYNFEVENIQLTRKRLISKGIDMNEIINATPTKLISSGRDPEGNGFFIEMTTE